MCPRADMSQKSEVLFYSTDNTGETCKPLGGSAYLVWELVFENSVERRYGGGRLYSFQGYQSPIGPIIVTEEPLKRRMSSNEWQCMPTSPRMSIDPTESDR